MRVAGERGAALDLVFEFTDADAELVVELLLLAELRGLLCERRLGPGEFFDEARDEGLLRASDPCLGVGDPSLDLFEVAEHGAGALRVKAEEVTFVDHSSGLESRAQGRKEGRG